MKIIRAGIDIAKSVFHIHGVDAHGQVQWQAKLNRGCWVERLCEHLLPGAEVDMEACAAAHHWGRELEKRGVRVKLIAAQFVKPYVKSNKNDRADAEPNCGAMSRPGMRFVTLKSVAQQDRQAAYRMREELVGQRTSKANQIRGLVGEYGIVAPIGIKQLRRTLPRWLDEEQLGLTDEFRILLADLASDLRHLDDRIVSLDEWIRQDVEADTVEKRFLALRGVGPLTASALAGALGDGKAFSTGRDFAASVGLTPRQHSTGGKERLLGFSKRGDGYLCKLFVHGARAVLRYASKRDVLGYRRFRHPVAEFHKLAMNTRRIPSHVLGLHPADETAEIDIDRRPTRSTEFPCPIFPNSLGAWRLLVVDAIDANAAQSSAKRMGGVLSIRTEKVNYFNTIWFSGDIAQRDGL